MQSLGSPALMAAYHARLQSSHDFAIEADILTLDEVMIGSASLLDGQVNIQSGDGTVAVRRTASLTLSDPDGALDFSSASAWSGTTIWADRLIRIRHIIDVPGFGEVTAIPFVGTPNALSRSGAEVSVECQDKTALALPGAKPFSVAKGANAAAAIRSIMSHCTGEFRFRIPAYTRRLSKPYVVGLAAEAGPFVVASAIARAELDMVLDYSCDGALVLRPLPSQAVVRFDKVTSQASGAIDFQTVANYVRVRGKVITHKSKKKTQVHTTVVAPVSNSLSAQKLARKGVPRYLPLLIDEDGYTKTAQTTRRANSELAKSLGVNRQAEVSVIPMFHLDADDIAAAATGEGTITIRLSDASIPVGVGGDMTIGARSWVSKPALVHK